MVYSTFSAAFRGGPAGPTREDDAPVSPTDKQLETEQKHSPRLAQSFAYSSRIVLRNIIMIIQEILNIRYLV